jgi:transcriptional regulator with XRE-family HTH domain
MMAAVPSRTGIAVQVGATLKRLRAERQLRQYMLADLAGMAKPTLCRYETGDRCPSLLSLVKLLAALGVSWQHFGRELAQVSGGRP